MSWLQPTPEDKQDIQQLRKEQPELYAYAQVLALALRIDSRLLRNLRLHFLPKSSVELETELWFSPLIHTRNVQAATMYSGIARALCDALKNENLARFASAKTEIGKLTQHWPETERIEQEMRWAVLEGDEQALKNNVQRILNTLTLAEGDFEKRELARWVKGTLPILKATTQADTEQQWLSQYVAASLGVAGSWWKKDAELQALPDALVKALPKAKTQEIGLRLRPGVLEILKPEKGLKIIEISIPLPTTAMLTLPFENVIKTIEPLWVGRIIRLPTTIQSMGLKLLDGSLFKLSHDNPIFDVFLAHNGKDKAIIRKIKQLLQERDLSCWLDEDELQPGANWMPLLEKAISQCQGIGVFVSSNGIGPWEDVEIQAWLTKTVRNKIPVIPVLLPGTYDAPELPLFLGNRTFIDMRSGITPERIDKLYWGITGKKPEAPPKKTQTTIHSDRLPTVKGGFFGREAELQLLTNAWQENSGTNIIQFIAPGGTGKTKLLRHWLDHTSNIPVLIAWSFYSQGASEDKQTSTTPFFTHALEKLGSTRKFVTEEEKGEHLADLLHRQRCVLVLDSLETLQHTGSGMRGELKDRAIRQLLKSLAGRNNGLCIITTRIAVRELADRSSPAVVSHDMQNLALADGVKLLQSLGVQGKPSELEKAVREYGYHALALTLLSNVLRLRYQGDVQKRDTLKALVKPTGSQESRHAFKVMQAYEDWFAGQPELALLHLLGLFDHPITQDVLQILWNAQIPHLTAGIDENDWLEAIAGLREEHHLLSQHDGDSDLDCHPLIREYFGKQLQTQHPDSWQQAHARLYDYYKALPEKELPDTLEEMQPLFSAVIHGCTAGLHRRTLNEVYWPRIQRMDQNYLTKKLGAFSDDLKNLGNFFTDQWHTPSVNLTEREQAVILNWAGFRLRSLGRLQEAIEPTRASLNMLIKQKDWEQAAAQTSNLSELQISIGSVAAAVDAASKSMNYADQSENWQQRVSTCLTYAHTLHLAGEIKQAITFFQKAEQLQQENRPNEPYLYGQGGFRYCDLLLEQKEISQAHERAKYVLEISRKNGFLLDIALGQLILGCTYLQQENFTQATHWLEQAVSGLRASGNQSHLPLGLLVRTSLLHHTHNFARARQDLQEVFDIAEPAGMRLHLTDYHLEMARLLIAEGEFSSDSVNGHLNYAAKLISETGYHRRDVELAELQTSSSPQAF
jgi:tetratricopeptide (TPR) repeat protein